MKYKTHARPIVNLLAAAPKGLQLAAFTAGAFLAGTSFAANNPYFLSGSTGAIGSQTNPQSTLKLVKNDVVILDANKITGAADFTPWVAINPDITVSTKLSNYNEDIKFYKGFDSRDPAVYSIRKPYEHLNELLSAPTLTSYRDLMPNFFTQSNPVYLSGRIGQDNTESPDWIKALTTNGFNVWPLSIYSSDALDPATSSPTPRMDMQNAAWVVLTSSGSTPGQWIQLMDYYGDYSPPPAGSDRSVGNYSMITLEHVIFYGGRSAADGGAIDFKRTSGITNSSNRATVQIKGDVAFVSNMAAQHGGAIGGWDSLQFDGNSYFVGNMAGAAYNASEGGIFLFNTGGEGSHFGSGGALRLGSGTQNLIFNKDAIFIGNLAAAEGGAISAHNASTIRFNGKAVFMGNMSGMWELPAMQRGGGNGGAISFGDATNDRAYFYGDSYFIANQAGGFGGALGTVQADMSTANIFFQFSAPALFSDNISGVRPETTLIYSGTNANKKNGVFTPPVNISGTVITMTGLEGTPTGVWAGETDINVYQGKFTGTNSVDGTFNSGTMDYGAKVRGGGAIFSVGAYVLFDQAAPAHFVRNSTNGIGGALYLAKNNTATSLGSDYIQGVAGAFYSDASFIGNTADANAGAIQAGLYGDAVLSGSSSFLWDPTTVTTAAVYFGRAGIGSTLTMHGNISYSQNPVKAVSTHVNATDRIVSEVPLFGGGAVFAVGGLYVESMYSFWHNQTKGDGGAILIGSGSTPALVAQRMGNNYSLILDPLDWKSAGSYSKAGDWALLQNNVAMRNGGAIGSYDGAKLYIGSGAKFIDNYSGRNGGAIALGLTSNSTSAAILSGAPLLTLRASVDDIIFTGNRAGVTIDASQVDFTKILDPNRTNLNGISSDGYMQLDPASGWANDIYVGAGARTTTSSVSGTLNMDAYSGMKIYFDGGIAMDNSKARNLVVNINTITNTTGTSIGSASTTMSALGNTAPVGLVVFDNASAEIEGITTVGSGTLRIQGASNTLHWGSGTSTARASTLFTLGGNATLEANATINAATIKLGDGATLRVLGNGANPGALTLNAGAGGVSVSSTAKLNLAGNGRMNLGIAALGTGQIASLTIGDKNHASAQTLTLAKDPSSLANVTLDSTKLTLGLFDGGTSDSFTAADITLGGGNTISLSSLAQGSFTIATGVVSGIHGAAIATFDYKGTTLSNVGRMALSTSIVGNDLQLNYTTSNILLNWNAGSGTWDRTSANWTGAGDTKYMLGDAIIFGAGHTGTVTVSENVAASGIAIADNYIFDGAYGITTAASAWGGAANSAADGRLTMNAAGKTLTLANAMGAGQRNEFTGGILIQAGTLAAGNEAQLGAALSQIDFANTTNNGATLLINGTMTLDGATSLHSQQLTIATNNTASIATSASGGVLNVVNNTVSGNGGVFNVGSGATLNLNAQGDMSFLNNTAAQGGVLALADNATANLEVASGKTVMIGLQSDRTLRTAANASTTDSLYGTTSSIINKTGAGVLSINSDSSHFAGTLNVNEGKLMLGENSAFGSSASHVNVSSGAILGGASTIGGDLRINNGTLSIDAGAAFGRASATSAQTLTILGSLGLNGATVKYNAVTNKSNEYSADLINVGGIVNITGTTLLDFNSLNRGSTLLIQATGTSSYISLAGNTSQVSGGILAVTGSGTDWKAKDFVITKAGVALDTVRYDTSVEYPFAYTVVVTSSMSGSTTVTATTTYNGTTAVTSMTVNGTTSVSSTVPYNFNKGDTIPVSTGVTLVNRTDYYDSTKLQLLSEIYNQKIYWTGITGTTWNNTDANWYVTDGKGNVSSDKTFAAGDSIVFGATGTNGTPYDAGHEANRIINIDPVNNARVADVTFTGTGNWTLTGGKLISIAGANNYTDATGKDLSTGQLVLDSQFTGTVALNNDSVTFNGIYVASGSKGGMVKSKDIEIRNGTLVATAGKLGENLILNNSILVFNQGGGTEIFKGQVSGTGNIVQMQSGTSTAKITLNDTGFVSASNYDLQSGQLQVDTISGLTVTNTLTIRAAGGLLVTKDLNAANVINSGVIVKTPVNGDAQKPPTSLKDSDHLRDPGVGNSTMTFMGNYYSNNGTIVLNTFRDSGMINNIVVKGNSDGVSHVVIRNIASMDTDSTPTSVLGTGTYFRPDGRPDSVNAIAKPKRDTLIFATQGAERNIKLIMDQNDWNNSILPTATIGSIVPFATVTSDTNQVVTTITKNTTISASGTIVTSSTSAATTPIATTTTSAHYFNKNGTIAPLVASGTVNLGTSSTTTTSGTLTTSGTTVITDTLVITGTTAVTTSAVTYGPSEIDYSETRDHYQLVQGKNGNWYFRNATIALTSADLPMIGAAPVMADMIGQGNVKAFYQHIAARHDTIEKGLNLWTNYTHSEDRLRKDYYNGTMIKQDIFQAGADYALVKSDGKFSTTPSVSFGGAYAFTTAKAVRSESPAPNEAAYTESDNSTLSANINTFTGYASARWWRLYLDALVEYSPDASYKTDIDATVPFDMDGTVKGSRIGASAELGIIITPKRLGQLELYTQATGQKHDFSAISSIQEPTKYTNLNGYNPFYDPSSPTGRHYHFSSPTTFRVEGGMRWGSHLNINDTIAVRPWAGVAYGRVASSDYIIYVDEHQIRNDMRGNYYTFQGGAAALFRKNWEYYLTLGWTGGEPTNNYTLSTGLNYHW